MARIYVMAKGVNKVFQKGSLRQSVIAAEKEVWNLLSKNVFAILIDGHVTEAERMGIHIETSEALEYLRDIITTEVRTITTTVGLMPTPRELELGLA